MNKLEFVNALLRPMHLIALRNKQYKKLIIQNDILSSLLEKMHRPTNPGINGIVFSKDRALQLHALLESFFLHSTGDIPKLTIMYTCSSAAHNLAYSEVMQAFSDRNIDWKEESDFRHDLINTLESVHSDHIFFLVDDIVFIRRIDFSSLCNIANNGYVISLRLGAHICFSYTKQKPMKLPDFIEDDTIDNPELLTWQWREGELDWNYPLSVDGNIFYTHEIREITKRIPFSAPNSYERSLQLIKPLFESRVGICYQNARLVNLPINRVQTEIDNIFGALDADRLLSEWNLGMKIDIESLRNSTTISAHQELDIAFIQR